MTTEIKKNYKKYLTNSVSKYSCLCLFFAGIVATRAHLNQCEPKFTVRLHLENSEQEKQVDIELCAQSVLSIASVLEQALSHAKLNQRKMSVRKQMKNKA